MKRAVDAPLELGEVVLRFVSTGTVEGDIHLLVRRLAWLGAEVSCMIIVHCHECHSGPLLISVQSIQGARDLSYVYTLLNSAPRIVIPAIANIAG